MAVLPVFLVATIVQAVWGSAIDTQNVGVTGGTEIPIEQANYMALIYTLSDAPCGAVIIDESYLLTTSTCCIGTTQNVYAFVGTNRQDQQGKKVTIEKFIRYQNNLKPSLCLVKLQNKLEFDSKVGKIQLDDGSNILARGTPAKLTAFGAKNKIDESPRQLRQGWLRISDSDWCKKESVRLGNGLICAGDPTHNACYGDVGGALTIQNPLTLIGVVSEIPNDCEYQETRFSRISKYRSWIESTIHPKQ